MSDDPYVYRGTTVLKNKFSIRDSTRLDYVEREAVAQRISEGLPKGDFDLDHLKAIHRHLFQDVYDWAGEIRTVEIAKGGSQFQFRQYIGTGMADVHRRIVAGRYLRTLGREAFAVAAGPIIGDVNYIHPFREGNGRTQLQYLRLLAERAGHDFDVTRIDPERWQAASRAAHMADYAPMSDCILAALIAQS